LARVAAFGTLGLGVAADAQPLYQLTWSVSDSTPSGQLLSRLSTKDPATKAPRGRITDLTGIPLQIGPNRISRFAPDGRDAEIILAWQSDGRGGGRDVFFVTMPRGPDGEWRTVDLLEGANPTPSAIITDDPGQGHDVIRSVRFARGRVDGETATLLLIATRAAIDQTGPSNTLYEVYRLMQIGGKDQFRQISQQLLPDRYCNADVALTVASGLPLRSSYRGPRGSDGVFILNGCPDSAISLAPRNGASRMTPSSPSKPSYLSQEEKEDLFQRFLDWRAFVETPQPNRSQR